MSKVKSKILISLLVLSVGCTSQLINTPDNAATSTTEPTQTLTPIVEPTDTATPIIPTKTPTLIPSPTWTPLPTLSISFRNAKIQELLETNGGCQLPCWWGITPEKTSWSEAIHFLSPFIVRVGQGGIIYHTEGGRRHRLTNFGIYYEIAGESEQGRIYFGVIDDTVYSMEIFPPGTVKKYQLNQLMSSLGIPRQVYIAAQSSSPFHKLPPARIILDYSDIGIWGVYSFVPSAIGEKLYVCPQHVGAELFLYDPTAIKPAYFLPYFRPRDEFVEALADNPGKPQRIEDVTNMTTEVFYTTFSNPASNICLETPANLWH